MKFRYNGIEDTNPALKDKSLGIGNEGSIPMRTPSSRSKLVWLAEVVAIAAIYYGTGRLGLLMSIPPGIATVVWPPSGIALAAVLLQGYRVWPAIWLGAFLVNIQTLFDSPGDSSVAVAAFLVAGSIGVGSTLQALLGAFLIQRFIGSRSPFDRAQDVFKFVGIEVLSCIVSPTFGVTSASLSGFIQWTAYVYNWWTWWLGDMVGVILVAPMLLIWSEQTWRRWEPWRIVEAVLLLVLLFTLGRIVFGGQFGIGSTPYSLTYTFIPFLVWMAFRFGQSGVAMLTLMLSGVAIWGTINGFGPFVRETQSESLLLLQAFMGIVSMTGLVLAATLTERKRAEDALKENLAQLTKKNRYETIISTVTRSVHQSINLQDVLENAVEAMNENIGGVDYIGIYLVEGQEAVLRTYRGFPDRYIERAGRIPYPKGFIWKTIIEGKPRYVADVDQDTVIGPAGREVGTKSYLSMPIRFGGKTIGVIGINSLQKNAFNEEELKLLEIVAQQIEIAINNVQQAESLEKSRDFYLKLFDEFPTPIWQSGIDAKCNYFNKSWLNFTGRTMEQEMGDGWAEGVHPKDLDRVVKTYLEAFHARKPFEMEYRLRRYDGEYRWIIDFGRPFYDLDGNFAGYIGSCYDITERKRAEEALRESEERYRTLVEHTYDLISETSIDGRFLYVSPKHKDVLGYELSELVGRDIFEHIHPDDRSAVIAEFERVVKTFSSGQAVFRYRHKNGEWRWFEGTGNLLKTATGEIRGVIDSRDITERKRMEEELLKAQKLESIGVLAGGIAHDFNNLLTAILGNVSLTKMYADPEDKMYERLTEAERACLRAKDLTGQLLTFSKGGAPVKKVTSIGELIKDSASFAVSGSNVRCEFSIAEGLWQVEIDEGQISQVINNLVINAEQAMPEGGVIKVRAENSRADPPGRLYNAGEGLPLKDGRYVRITIEDHGIGILEEHLSKIFDPYFTTKQEGSGLGLATAYSIIKSHDGYIGVESELGIGTKFYIYLPVSQKEILGKRGIKERPVVGRGRILVMDDEEVVREVAGEILSHIGYEVEFARDGAEAIELYRRAKENNKPFDVVIMDLTIPGRMGGKEAIKRLLEIDPGVKAIVSSGYSNDPVMSEYRKYGFRGVVAKPYNIEELGKTVHEMINGENK